MKKIFLFCLFLLLLSACKPQIYAVDVNAVRHKHILDSLSQKAKNYRDVQGRMQGLWVHPVGNAEGKILYIHSYSNYKDDLWHGKTYILKEEELQIHSITDYKDGVAHGLHQVYGNNGFLAREIMYKDGYEHGFTKYYDITGTLVAEVEKSEGVFTGYSVYYIPADNLRIEFHFKPDEETGVKRTYKVTTTKELIKEVDFENAYCKRVRFYKNGELWKEEPCTGNEGLPRHLYGGDSEKVRPNQ